MFHFLMSFFVDVTAKWLAKSFYYPPIHSRSQNCMNNIVELNIYMYMYSHRERAAMHIHR